MSPDSLTEREITRSIHFGDAAKTEAHPQATFYRDQIVRYLDEVFKNRDDYLSTCAARSETDCTYTIRKGSAVLEVETSFGLNTSYKEQPPRKFYTFTATARHRNEVLDNTDKVNDVIEWTCRIVGGVVLGFLTCVLLVLFTGHLSGTIITLGFGGGAAVGSYIGQLISHRIYRTMEKRLEAKGEITAVDQEWATLGETLGIVFDAAEPTAE